MQKKIFKTGDYGEKGRYSKDDVSKWVGKEFNITPGHIGDWITNGYPISAIPIAGSCKITGIDDEGYVLAEFSYNQLGESIKDKYPNLSIGIGEDNSPNHIAILGYAPPHIKDLSKSFSETVDLSQIKNKYIEFSDIDDKPTLLEQIMQKTTEEQLSIAVSIIEKLDATEANITGMSEAVQKIFDKQDLSLFIEKLKSKGYTVEKTTAEFSSKEEIDKYIETSLKLKEFTANVKATIPEKFHKLIEFSIENSKNVDKEERENIMNEIKIISEFFSNNIFKNHYKDIEFSEENKNITNSNERIKNYFK